MSKFLVNQDPVVVTIEYYADPESKYGMSFLDPKSDNFEELRKKHKDNLNKLTAHFHQSSWGRVNRFSKKVFAIDKDSGFLDYDEVRLRTQRIKELLFKLEDEGEGEIEVNEDFFERMIPDLGFTLLNAYDRAIE